MYTIFGSCKDVNIGPTAIMALMIQPHVEKFGPDGAILLTFLTGCIVFILGLLNLGINEARLIWRCLIVTKNADILGFVVQFFSYPVIAGFTSAAAVQIASTQFNSLFGIRRRSNEFLDAIITVFDHLNEITLWNSILGFCSIAILLSMKVIFKYTG